MVWAISGVDVLPCLPLYADAQGGQTYMKHVTVGLLSGFSRVQSLSAFLRVYLVCSSNSSSLPPLPRHSFKKMHALYLATLMGLTSASSHLKVMEDLRHVPEGWHSVGAPEASRPLSFRVAVTQPNEALFEQNLLDISTPSHPRYGRHMKREELKHMLRPATEASEAVKEWLEESGITSLQDDGEWINFLATTEQVEELLDTRFAIYRHGIQNIGESKISIF